jgi:hypothetical protein
MKVAMIVLASVLMVGGLSACGKTLTELRTNGDAVVDNATGFAGQTLSTVGTIVKKIIGVGFAVYDIGKKMIDDTTDNVGTVTGGVIGTAPTK